MLTASHPSDVHHLAPAQQSRARPPLSPYSVVACASAACATRLLSYAFRTLQTVLRKRNLVLKLLGRTRKENPLPNRNASLSYPRRRYDRRSTPTVAEGRERGRTQLALRRCMRYADKLRTIWRSIPPGQLSPISSKLACILFPQRLDDVVADLATTFTHDRRARRG